MLKDVGMTSQISWVICMHVFTKYNLYVITSVTVVVHVLILLSFSHIYTLVLYVSMVLKCSLFTARTVLSALLGYLH